ncbi:hypothetical protein D3C75_756160 [compost metagenome]
MADHKLLDFLWRCVTHHIQIENGSVQPGIIGLIERFRCNAVEIGSLAQRMKTVRFLAAHFLNAALSGITDFIVDDGLQLLAYCFTFSGYIGSTEASILQQRFRQYVSEKRERFAQQAFFALHEGIIDRIHTKLDNLIVASFINVKAEAGTVQLLQTFAELRGFGIIRCTSAEHKGNQRSRCNRMFVKRNTGIEGDGEGLERLGRQDVNAHACSIAMLKSIICQIQNSFVVAMQAELKKVRQAGFLKFTLYTTSL